MNDVAEVDLTTLWACAPAQALEETVGLCQQALKCRGAFVGAFSDAGGMVIRAIAGSVDPTEAEGSGAGGDNTRVMTMPLHIAGQLTGTLGAVAEPGREWTPEDRTLLGGLADSLAKHLELNDEVTRRRAVDSISRATAAGFLSVSENIPALVFERRKIDAGRSSYRFFGRSKTDLPAVRELIEQGESGSLRFVVRDDRDAVRAALLRSNLEETDLDITFRVKDFGRRVRWVRSQSIVRKDPDGDVVWDGFCFDISDLVASRDVVAVERSALAQQPIASDVVTDPLKAIIEICEFLKTETQPALIAAHARTIQATSEALLALVRPPSDLPRDSEELRALEPPRELEPPLCAGPGPSSGARILVADDLDLNRKLISDMLGLDGHKVDSVADGAAALEAVLANHYDLVLMDMVMPGMDGLAATQAIRALPGIGNTLPIIGLTAHSEEEELDRCRAAGMDAVLTKPMSMEALSAIVADWTRNRQAA